MFKNISIVLVGPQHSGNIGSAARAMKNTGLRNLVLVNPADHQNNDALSLACNAGDVLRQAKVFPTLKKALKGMRYVAGTTRRKGHDRFPLLTFQEAIPKILNFSQKNNVAILFGREDDGLATKELNLCNIFIEIPTHEDYPSLNLAQAVFLICYEMFRQNTPPLSTIKLAPEENIKDMYRHVEKVLGKLGYGEKEKGGQNLPKAIMRSIKRLLGRSGLMQYEVNLIRGLCTQVEKKLRGKF